MTSPALGVYGLWGSGPSSGPLAGRGSLVGCDLIKCSFSFSGDFLTRPETVGFHRRLRPPKLWPSWTTRSAPSVFWEGPGQLPARSIAEPRPDTHSGRPIRDREAWEEGGPEETLSKGSLTEGGRHGQMCPEEGVVCRLVVVGEGAETLGGPTFIILGDLCDLGHGQIVINSFSKH